MRSQCTQVETLRFLETKKNARFAVDVLPTFGLFFKEIEEAVVMTALADGDLFKVRDPSWLDDFASLGDLLVAARLGPALM